MLQTDRPERLLTDTGKLDTDQVHDDDQENPVPCTHNDFALSFPAC